MTKRIFAAAFVCLFSITALISAGLAIAQALNPAPVRLAPVGYDLASNPALPPEVQQIEADSLELAFDRDATTGLVLFDTASVTVDLEAGASVSALRILGPAPYAVSVEAISGNGNNAGFAAVGAVQNIDLSAPAEGWQSLPFGTEIATPQLRLTFTSRPGGAGTGLPEIELWGAGETARAATGSEALAMLGNGDEAGPYRMYRDGGTISISQNKPTGGISVSIPYAPQDIRRAWLSYELRGVHSWLAVRRAINGAPEAGGYVAAEENNWSSQIEEISPERLVQGVNTVMFGTLAGQERDFSLRDVALIIELDNGHHLVAGSGALTDGDPATSILAVPDGSGAAVLDLPLARVSAVEELALTFAAAPTGTVTIEAVDGDGIATPVLTDIALATDPAVTVAGSAYTVALGGAPAETLRLSFSSSAELSGADATGSPAGQGRDPEALAVTWPQNGEYYGRTGFLRGHILPGANASGPADFFVAGLPFDAPGGVFEVAISMDQAGFGADADETSWSVEIVALYPDGASVVREIAFNTPVFIEGLSTYTPGVLAETFSPAEDKTVTHEEAELTVVAGALSAPTEIRISALTDIELAKLDTGLINVTKGPRRGYRMLPHMKFNAKNRLKLPYNKSRIPRGYTEADVRLFYFDEDAGRWIALENTAVDEAAGKVAADTDHFTDFIAGVVVAPESPQVASYNPTQLKDMKVADPSAKINLISAPQAASSGDMTLSYPLELPPGRQGLAPQLGLQYSSAAGNGWMGMGWNMSMQEVMVDTRWGVPRYSQGAGYAGLETETYMWNGQQLTPVAHRGALVPREPERVFHTRVEGGFN
ncbi:MAG: hypothetical protein KJN93_01165, partial [Alphaproteobacteria bacterium]|nr:hypothetical protein [Alphaproteobacteria bacterium]